MPPRDAERRCVLGGDRLEIVDTGLAALKQHLVGPLLRGDGEVATSLATAPAFSALALTLASTASAGQLLGRERSLCIGHDLLGMTLLHLGNRLSGAGQHALRLVHRSQVGRLGGEQGARSSILDAAMQHS